MEDLLPFCSALPIHEAGEGDVLIEQGRLPAGLLVLVEGTAVIERDGIAFSTLESPGTVLGEMSVVLGKPATATVRARSACRFHVARDANGFLYEHPGAALVVLRTLAGRLDALLAYLDDVKDQFAGQDGHVGMVGEVIDALIHHQAHDVRTGSARDPDPEY